MGTIAEKLTYLDGTKQALKTSINNLGGDITSETTFREYAQELDNIYDNLPKTTGESSNLSLTTIKGKMNTTLKGDTSQDGTPTPDTLIDTEVVTGTQEVKVENVNLFDLTNVVNKQTTSSISGDSITLTPTATWARIEEIINVVAGQTYTISLGFTNASGNKVKLTTFDGTTDTGGPSSSTNTSGSFTFTITPITTELKVQIYANFSDTLTTNQVTFSNIQVEKRKFCNTIYTTPRTNTNNIFRRYRIM